MRRLVLLLCTALTCCTAAGSAPRVAEAALLREGGSSGLPRGTGTVPPPSPRWVLLIFPPPRVSRRHPRRAAGGQAGACAGGEGAGEVPSPLLAPRRRGRLRARRGPPPAVGGLRVQRHGENLLHHPRLDGKDGGRRSAFEPPAPRERAAP